MNIKPPTDITSPRGILEDFYAGIDPILLPEFISLNKRKGVGEEDTAVEYT